MESDPDTSVLQADGLPLRTWRDRSGYSISLLFDARDLCLGVEEERI
ncbi:MAG: hypothetical protein IKS31_05130 [Clostridia bacterium]|nr:hypothetical protein [Clostridia bacterium]MBR4458323.1 hypothetical protein [Clostridia bacterium]